MRVAYLAGTYPRATYTFITREIQALRRAGDHVETFAVRSPPQAELVAGLADEHRRTDALLGSAPRLVRDVTLAVLRSPGPSAEAARLAWATRRPGARRTATQLAYLVEALALATRLRRRRIEHLHAHLGDTAASVAMLAAVVAKVPWSFTLHGPGIFFEAHDWRLDVKCERASFCACISWFCRSQALAVAPGTADRLHLVRCGVIADDYAPRTHRGTGRRIVVVGRLAPVKAVDDVLDAAARLAGRGVEVELVVIGDGPRRPDLERQAATLGLSARTTFVGALGAAQVADELARADVFVSASYAEGLPVSIMEAMAAGLPVVATQVGGVAELVETGVTGTLVRPGDVDQLAEAVGRLLADGDRRARLGAAGRRAVVERHDVGREAARLQRLMADPPAAPVHAHDGPGRCC